MDFQLMQWRNQQQQDQSDHQLKQEELQEFEKKQKLQQEHHQSPSAALPLFLTEPVSKVGNLSGHSDMASTSRFPKMTGGQFSLAQWQELELQAVIFRYMLAGTSVPAELLQSIKTSLLNSSSFFLHHPLQHYSHFQPATAAALLQSGYWGRAGMDPEPGRCRRTDGKKWRCSRDVAAGHKYCDRHMNRGRNRSRKPVEIPKPRTISPTSCIPTGGGEFRKTVNPSLASTLGAASASGPHFNSFGRASHSADMLHLNNRTSNVGVSSRSLLELNHNERLGMDGRGSSDGRVLRPFFDDWPRSLDGSNTERTNDDLTSLSMSIQGNSASDVSLKLATGSGNEEFNSERDRMQLNWMEQWGQHQAGPMGGPLAEALRSSNTARASPTSVLHELARSETAYATS